MRKITIEVYEHQEDGLTKVFINNEHESHFRKITDLSKQVLIALADYFKYEPSLLLEFDDDTFDIDDDDDFLEVLADAAETEEMIAHWLEMLCEANNVDNVDDLTAKDIEYEIDQVEGTIENESMWTNGEILEDMLAERK